MKTKCEICGKEFRAIPANIKRGWGRFCSWACRSKNVSLNMSGDKSPKWSRVKIQCAACGKDMFIAKCRVGRTKCCSKKCGVVFKSSKYSGDGNPFWGKTHTGQVREILRKVNTGRVGKDSSHWMGGITPGHLLIRTSIKYAAWRGKVFERDNFTCQKCGDGKGGNLNAHHIKPFARFPELRLEVSNGVTLCEKCHIGEHRR